MKLALTAFAVLATVGVASAQIKPSGQGYLLRRSFDSKPAVYSWNRAMTTSVSTFPPMTMEVQTQVVKKSPKSATIKYTVSPRGPKPQVHLVSRDARNDGPSPNPLTGIKDVVFPKEAVKIGQKWTSEIVVAELARNPIQVSFQLTGFKVVDGVKLANIKGEGYVDRNGTRVWVKGFYAFRVSDGSLQSVSWTQESMVRAEHSASTVSIARKS